jgi:hypothetical protein
MQRGMQVDPDNALYHYLITQRLLKDDASDKRLLHQAIIELQRAIAKPYLRTYTEEMKQAKLAALPPAQSSLDALYRPILVDNRTQLRQSDFRGLIRKLPDFADALRRNGQTASADAMLHAWEPIIRQAIADDSYDMMDMLSYAMMAVSGSRQEAEAYAKLGRPAQSAFARSNAKQIDSFWRQLTTQRVAEKEKTTAYLRAHGSILAAISLPIYGNEAFTAAELTPSRLLEYTQAEEAGASLFLVFFTPSWCTNLWWHGAGKLPCARSMCRDCS